MKSRRKISTPLSFSEATPALLASRKFRRRLSTLISWIVEPVSGLLAFRHAYIHARIHVALPRHVRRRRRRRAFTKPSGLHLRSCSDSAGESSTHLITVGRGSPRVTRFALTRVEGERERERRRGNACRPISRLGEGKVSSRQVISIV